MNGPSRRLKRFKKSNFVFFVSFQFFTLLFFVAVWKRLAHQKIFTQRFSGMENFLRRVSSSSLHFKGVFTKRIFRKFIIATQIVKKSDFLFQKWIQRTKVTMYCSFITHETLHKSMLYSIVMAFRKPEVQETGPLTLLFHPTTGRFSRIKGRRNKISETEVSPGETEA